MAERWWWELKKPLHDVKPGERYDLEVKREAIPIIFLPGIMGSRLKQRQGGKVVWDPDKWGGAWMLTKYGMFWQRGGKKKEELVGDTYSDTFLEVSVDDADHNEKLPPKADGEAEGPIERGWGGVMWGTYGAIIKRLSAPETWLMNPRVGLFFDLPVYAHGYNWTADVAFAARELADRIKKIIKKHEAQRCRHVILVTHSMGGIVARATCALPGVEAQVLGVVHGVQPVHGSGAGYWRMKGGFERPGLAPSPSAWVLGTDGKEVTRTLAEMPGGLALLPNRLYGPDWLEIFDFDADRTVKLPKSDPYDEIYGEKERYWRLVNPDYLVGAKSEKSKSAGRAGQGEPAGPWSNYLKNLRLARTVHVDLEKHQQHRETHYFLGTKLKSAGTIKFTASEWVPSGEEGPPPAGAIFDRDGFSTYLWRGGKVYEVAMSRPADDGDGTVPSTSARALKQQGDSHGFDLPWQAGPPKAEFERMEHQPAYEQQEGQAFSIDAIRRLCLLRMKKGGP